MLKRQKRRGSRQQRGVVGHWAQPTGTKCGLIVLSRIDSGFSQNGLSGCYTLKGKKFPRVGL